MGRDELFEGGLCTGEGCIGIALRGYQVGQLCDALLFFVRTRRTRVDRCDLCLEQTMLVLKRV